MKSIKIIILTVVIVMLPIDFATGSELSDWRARLVDRIWWFENEKTLHEIERNAKALKEETDQLNKKHSQVYKRFFADGKQIPLLDQKVKAMKIDIAQKKKQYINVIDEERKLAKAEALLTKIKDRHKANEKKLKEFRAVYDGKMKDLKNLEASIQAWRNHQPDINRISKASSGQGEIFFNDIPELFEHILFLIENYDLMPDQRASDIDMDLVRGFPLKDLMGMMEQGESGRFKHPSLEKVFYDPEGIKTIIARLNASGRKYGFSEKDRVTAMKMLGKTLAQATQTHGTDMPKESQAAQNLHQNMIPRQGLVQTDLTAMYDLFISTGATQRTPGKEDPK